MKKESSKNKAPGQKKASGKKKVKDTTPELSNIVITDKSEIKELPVNKTQEQVFNHKYGYLFDALGISKPVSDDIKKIVFDVLRLGNIKDSDTRTISEKFQALLSNGLSYMEVAYAFFILGRVFHLRNEIEGLINNPVMQILKSLTSEENQADMSPEEKVSEMFDKVFDKVNKNTN